MDIISDAICNLIYYLLHKNALYIKLNICLDLIFTMKFDNIYLLVLFLIVV